MEGAPLRREVGRGRGSPPESDIRTETRRIKEKLPWEVLGDRVNSRWPELYVQRP